MHPCYSKTELAQITRAHTKAGQIAFLRRGGIKHYIDNHGWPVVLRSTLETNHAPAHDQQSWSPNKAA